MSSKNVTLKIEFEFYNYNYYNYLGIESSARRKV